MCTSVQTTAEVINTIKLKGVMKNQYIKGSFFSKFQSFLYLKVFRKWQKYLTCSFYQIYLVKAL